MPLINEASCSAGLLNNTHRAFPSRIKVVSIRASSAVLALTAVLSLRAGVPCPSGGAVTEFQIEVEPPEGGEKLPITMVHRIPAGSKLHYHPGLDQKSKGQVSLLVVPRGGSELQVLPANRIPATPFGQFLHSLN